MPDPNDKSGTPEPATTPGTPFSLNIGRVAGIPIRLHFTFFLLLAWLAFGAPRQQPATGLAYVLGVFACVVLHELGHSVVAQRYGIRVAEIVLYPIGGVARMEKTPPPHAEFWIALAGPAVNVVIAAALYLGITLTGSIAAWSAVWNGAGHYAQMLLFANLLLVGFNLIPAFPMDGGRVLRSLLAMSMGEARATQLAATIGQLLAFGIGLLGALAGQPFLLLIALFVFFAAGQEAAMYRGKAFLEGMRVGDAVITEFRTLPAGASLGEAQDLLLHSSQVDFPIVNGDEVVGLLRRLDLFRGLREEGPSAYVAGVMERDYPVASPDDSLEELAMRMQTNQQSCTLVMQDGRLLGMITMENLAELLILRQIMQANRESKA